jgi:hypothetical protein
MDMTIDFKDVERAAAEATGMPQAPTVERPT